MVKTQHPTDETFSMKLTLWNLNVTIMACLLVVFVFLGATSYLYLQPSFVTAHRQEPAKAYRHTRGESFTLEYARKEWTRLNLYHGNPAVIVYEKGKTPYFYDKQGNKRAFTSPSQGIESLDDPPEKRGYSIALMPDRLPRLVDSTGDNLNIKAVNTYRKDAVYE